jgi:predicted nucleic acid-binding protein
MYVDTGIIVKLLVREPESDYFNNALSGCALDSSELCLTEVCSALLAKERSGGISGRERQRAMERLNALVDEEVLRVLPLTSRVLERARGILQACHPRIALRTLDALHVATCDIHRCDALCATDNRMRDAAAQLGLRLFPADLDELRF